MTCGFCNSLSIHNLYTGNNMPDSRLHLKPQTPPVGVVFLTGPNASGKGTIATTLLRDGVVQHHVSMGQLLRDVHQSATTNPEQHLALIQMLQTQNALQELGHCLNHGLLIPDPWTEALIEVYLRNHPELHTSLWVLDGYPRRIKAAEHLLSLLEHLHIPVPKVIHLQVPEHEVLRRSLLRNRQDDTEAAVRLRYSIYQKEVLPVIESLGLHLGADHIAHIDACLGGVPEQEARETIYQRVLDALILKPDES